MSDDLLGINFYDYMKREAEGKEIISKIRKAYAKDDETGDILKILDDVQNQTLKIMILHLLLQCAERDNIFKKFFNSYGRPGIIKD